MNISTIMVDEVSVMWGRSGNKITDVLIATAPSGGELTGQQRREKADFTFSSVIIFPTC